MGRIRQQGQLIAHVPSTWYAGPVNGPGVYYFQSPYPRGSVRTTEDVITPEFARRRAKGEVFNNPYSSSYVRYKGQDVTGSWDHPTWGGGWTEHGSFPIEIHGVGPGGGYLSDSLALAAAVNRANAGVNPSYTSLAVTVAELDKTRQMFREVGVTARNMLNAFIVAKNTLRGKRNNVKAQHEALQAIANTWLQGRYGWGPILYEVQGAIKALNEPKHTRQTARGTEKLEDSFQGELVFSHHGTFGSSWVRTKRTVYRAGVLYEDTKELSEQFASRLGLSASDALTVGYDLIPLSFVLDWAIDVGDWLRAVSPKPGCKTLAAWTTVHAYESYLHHNFWASPTDGWTFTGGGGSLVIEIETKTRITSATPTIPGYGSGLSTNRSIDAAMLSLQALKGFMRTYSLR